MNQAEEYFHGGFNMERGTMSLSLGLLVRTKQAISRHRISHILNVRAMFHRLFKMLSIIDYLFDYWIIDCPKK